MQHIGAVPSRHLDVAAGMIRGWTSRSSSCLEAVAAAGDPLHIAGVKVPIWEALAAGAGPEGRVQERARDTEPAEPSHEWQKVVSGIVDEKHREEVVRPLLSDAEMTSVGSQSGFCRQFHSPRSPSTG